MHSKLCRIAFSLREQSTAVVGVIATKMSLRRKIYIEVHRGEFISRQTRTARTIHTQCSQLNHQRTLDGNCDEIVASLKEVLGKHCSMLDRVLKPIVLLHLVPKRDGGYTASELAIFKQLCEKAGAGFCLLCDDKYGPLTDAQLKEVFQFW